MNHTQLLPLLMTGVMSFAGGVLVDGIAQDYRAQAMECRYRTPAIERDGVTFPAPHDTINPSVINKLCAHMEVTGRGHLCRRVEG